MELLKIEHTDKSFENDGITILKVSVDRPVFGGIGTALRRVNAYYRHWTSLLLKKAEKVFLPECILLFEYEGLSLSSTGCFLLEADGLAVFSEDGVRLSVTRSISFNGRSSITTDVWDAQSGWLVAPGKKQRGVTSQIPETA